MGLSILFKVVLPYKAIMDDELGLNILINSRKLQATSTIQKGSKHDNKALDVTLNIIEKKIREHSIVTKHLDDFNLYLQKNLDKIIQNFVHSLVLKQD